MKKYFKLIIFVISVLCLFVGGMYSYKKKTEHGGFQEGVVSLSPAATEILYELGVSRISALCDSCDYPKETKKIKKIGEEITVDPEVLAELEPSAVYMGEFSPDLEDFLEDMDISTIVVPDAYKIEDIFFNISLIALSQYKNADSLLKSLKKGLPTKPQQKIKVFIEEKDGLWTPGHDNYLSDLVEYAGGENIFKHIKRTSFKAALDDILKEKPSLIIRLTPGAKKTQDLPEKLKGIKVIYIDSAVYGRATPRAVRGIAELDKKIKATK